MPQIRNASECRPGQVFDLYAKKCYKDNPKNRRESIRPTKPLDVNKVTSPSGSAQPWTVIKIPRTLIEDARRGEFQSFLETLRKKYEVSSIGNGDNKVDFIRLSDNLGNVHDITLSGKHGRPLGVSGPMFIPHGHRSVVSKYVGTWLGVFDTQGSPIFTYGGKVFVMKNVRVPLNVSEETLDEARVIANASSKLVTSHMKPVKPKRKPEQKTQQSFVAAKIAKEAARKRKHDRNAKKKYDRLKKTRTYDEHKLLKQITSRV